MPENSPAPAIDERFARALALFREGKASQAEKICRQILKRVPDHADALHLAGAIALQSGKARRAIQLLEKSVAANSKVPDAFGNLGSALRQIGRSMEAIEAYDRALELSPDTAYFHYNQGIALHQAGRPAEAVEAYDRAISLRSVYPEAYNNRGIAYRDLGQFAEALESYDSAIRQRSAFEEAHSNRGNVLRDLGRRDEAVAAFDKALTLNADYAEAWCNRAIVLRDQQWFDEAVSSFERAIDLNPSFAEAHWNLSIALLQTGEFGKAWEHYDWRWRSRDFPSTPFETGRETWQHGADVRTLLIWSEQGVGDEILYSGMFGDARALAPTVIARVDPRLVSLFARSISGIEFLPADEPISEDAYDRQIAAGSLGRFVRTAQDDFPDRRDGFLIADEARKNALIAELCPNGERLCGLSWKSKNREFGAQKSFELSDFAPLFDMPGYVFVNLQYGDIGADLEALRERTGYDPLRLSSVDLFNDLDGLAALAAACDVVVSTSSTTAHIAGAVGTETFLLLTFGKGLLWYWENDRDGRNLWYPSVRPIRRRENGKDEEVVGCVRQALLARGDSPVS